MKKKHFHYALYDSLSASASGTRFNSLDEAKQEAESHHIIVTEISEEMKNGGLLIVEVRIVQAPDVWISHDYSPEYDGRYLAHLVRKETCGVFHEYQEVISNTFNKWQISENVKLINWKFLHFPETIKPLEKLFSNLEGKPQ